MKYLDYTPAIIFLIITVILWLQTNRLKSDTRKLKEQHPEVFKSEMPNEPKHESEYSFLPRCKYCKSPCGEVITYLPTKFGSIKQVVLYCYRCNRYQS